MIVLDVGTSKWGLAQQHPNTEGWQHNLTVSLDKIGDVQQVQGQLAAAVESYEASRAIAERLAQQDPSNSKWQHDLRFVKERIASAREALVSGR